MTAEGFFRFIKGKTVTVVGIGVSNTDLIRLLVEKGARVSACDKRAREEKGDMCRELEELGGTLHLGEDYLDHLDGDLVIRTPGLTFFHPKIQEVLADGRLVSSEMELFFDLCPCPIYGVSGSDGKTTTTTLIAEMLRAVGKTVHLGGNIGTPLFPRIEQVKPEDVAVVELSSFQLMSMRQSPDVAVITNVTPNHLDIHKDMAEYIAAKENLILHQHPLSRTVLGADNEISAGMAPKVRGELFTFSLEQPPRRGAYCAPDGTISMITREGTTPIMKKEEIFIPGMHNVANYLAAISAVWGTVDPQTIRQVAHTFRGVEHRIELVREVNGVKWYNDSIATSPTRTIAGLRCFPQKIIMLAGGYDKKISFDPMASTVLDHVKVLILTGPTAPKIEAAITGCPGYGESGIRILHARDLPQAVELARENALPGDVVSLCPACASFDAYPNFAVRGRHFKELVNAL